MAASAFNLGGNPKIKSVITGTSAVAKSSGATVSQTAPKSGICVVSASGDGGYFSVWLKQNGTQIAYGTRSGSETTFTDTSGMDFYWARQYAGGYFSKAFKVSSGDTVSIEFGTNGDSGDGTRRWAFSFIG